MLTKEQIDALPEPCAVRHSYDGYGWLYSDNGNGSFWLERAMEMPDSEPVYSAATIIEQQAEIEQLREALLVYADGCDATETTSCGYEGNMCCMAARKALGANQ